MASKLDEIIAQVTVKAAKSDIAGLLKLAAELAPQVTDDQAAKLPDRWYPKMTAKAAGQPKLSDFWPRAWFEAVVELLFQKGAAGLPALFELLERDDPTYHALVILRLLRLADAGVERKQIIAKIGERLPALHDTVINELAQGVVIWAAHDPQPLKLMRQFSKIMIKGYPSQTVGAYLDQNEEEQAEMRK